MYRAVIVEDNDMVSMLDAAFLSKDGRFQTVRTFADGASALPWLLRNPVDLLVLDVFMPGLTGVELLRELRSGGCEADAVMVTAAHDTATLDALLKLGVTDYLVKPFTRQRFQQALDRFCQRRETMAGRAQVSQADIDGLLRPAPAQDPTPKGLQEKTLDRVRAALQAQGIREVSCEELAGTVGLSVVTVRRYVNYLVDTGAAVTRMNYDTGGRPSAVYGWKG